MTVAEALKNFEVLAKQIFQALRELKALVFGDS
jgi:hypothetical protein